MRSPVVGQVWTVWANNLRRWLEGNTTDIVTLNETLSSLQGQIDDLKARVDAAAAVTPPSGGATVDSQARTAIAAVITGLA